MNAQKTDFVSFGLIEPITRAIGEEGYTTPTPIQAQSIPIVIAGKDLLGLAQTGTGKTAAFALPILHRLAASPIQPERKVRPIRALILTPTRELASQINDSFAAYGRHLKLRRTVIFGGVGQMHQQQALGRGVDILVATPGRLLDLIKQRLVKLDELQIFVLDEADRMLDMGFVHDVKRIIALLPRKRQTLFFSATMPPEAKRLADDLLVQPETVAVTPVSSTAEKVSQQIYFVEKRGKRPLLAHLIQAENMSRVLVFTRTKHEANRVAEYLTKVGIAADAIHGNKSQGARERALAQFKKGMSKALVATDIAARGIDIDDVSHVINVDLPNVPETYVHRIGRTARAGATGKALSFCSSEERQDLRGIERLIRMSIPVAATPTGIAAPVVELTPSSDMPSRSYKPHGARKPHGGGGRAGHRGQAKSGHHGAARSGHGTAGTSLNGAARTDHNGAAKTGPSGAVRAGHNGAAKNDHNAQALQRRRRKFGQTRSRPAQS